MSVPSRHYVLAKDLREGDVLSNGHRLQAVTVGDPFVKVTWGSSATKSKTRSTRFSRYQRVLIRSNVVQED